MLKSSIIFILGIVSFFSVHANTQRNITQFEFNVGNVATGKIGINPSPIANIRNDQYDFRILGDSQIRQGRPPIGFPLRALQKPLDGILLPGAVFIGQPHAAASRQYFREICPMNIRASFKITHVHRYADGRNDGRPSDIRGILSCGDIQNVNLHLIQQGMAWAHRTEHLGEIGRQMVAAQREAQAAGRGLWGLPNPTHPHKWRPNMPDARR